MSCQLNNSFKKNFSAICHRNVCGIYLLLSPHLPSLLHTPSPSGCWRLFSFYVELKLNFLAAAAENLVRTTYRRAVCYRGIHGRQPHLVDSYTWLEPLNNNVSAGELAFLVKCGTNSAASTAVYPLWFWSIIGISVLTLQGLAAWAVPLPKLDYSCEKEITWKKVSYFCLF